jgi:cold shock CspA family protein
MTQVGTIVELDPRGFGFVKGDDGSQLFFPAREVRGTTIDRLRLRMRVRYTPTIHPFKGPRAFSVQPLAGGAR